MCLYHKTPNKESFCLVIKISFEYFLQYIRLLKTLCLVSHEKCGFLSIDVVVVVVVKKATGK